MLANGETGFTSSRTNRQAWEESASPIGYPMVNVRDIESGKVRATRAMFVAD